MTLRMNNNEGSDYGSWEAGSDLHDEDDDFGGDVDDDDDADDHENHENDGSDVDADADGDVNDDVDNEDEDAFDVHAHNEVEEDNNPSDEYDSDDFLSDAEIARNLQNAEERGRAPRLSLQNDEERDMAAGLLTFPGLNDCESEVPEDYGDDSQNDDVDNEDEDAFDVHAHNEVEEDNNPSDEYDSGDLLSDEEVARNLQNAEERRRAPRLSLQNDEERDMAARWWTFPGLNDSESEVPEDYGDDSQDIWEEVDPDEIGFQSFLLPVELLSHFPSHVNYKAGTSQNGSNDSCVICRLDYEDGETLTVLSCKHSYHSECINNWLKINKGCPFCRAEVSTSGRS